MQEALERIKKQDASSTRPPTPQLTEDELQGYPTIFWPYLVRVTNGLIGITPEHCRENPGILEIYEVWAQQNKRQESFVANPRVHDWLEENNVSLELRPFFHLDPVFDRHGVRHDSKTNTRTS